MAGRGRVREHQQMQIPYQDEGTVSRWGGTRCCRSKSPHPAQRGQRLGQFSQAPGGGEAEAQALRRLPRHREDIGGHHLDPRGEAARSGGTVHVPRAAPDAGRFLGRTRPARAKRSGPGRAGPRSPPAARARSAGRRCRPRSSGRRPRPAAAPAASWWRGSAGGVARRGAGAGGRAKAQPGTTVLDRLVSRRAALPAPAPPAAAGRSARHRRRPRPATARGAGQPPRDLGLPHQAHHRAVRVLQVRHQRHDPGAGGADGAVQCLGQHALAVHGDAVQRQGAASAPPP